MPRHAMGPAAEAGQQKYFCLCRAGLSTWYRTCMHHDCVEVGMHQEHCLAALLKGAVHAAWVRALYCL